MDACICGGRFTVRFSHTLWTALAMDTIGNAFGVTVYAAANPFTVMFSLILSWGTSMYDHGLPPCSSSCSLAYAHQVAAASAFAKTTGSVISSAALGSH